MIKEVLRLVNEGGAISKNDLMVKLEIQESTLEDVFSLLTSKGYLKKTRNTTPSKESMSTATSAFARIGNVCNLCSEYEITSKGKTFLESK